MYSISYNTGKSALPDIYTQCPRAHGARKRVCIYQAKQPVGTFNVNYITLYSNLKTN